MTAFKDYLGGRDVKFWDGIARTFSRLTSTGGSLTQNKIGYMVDVLEVYGAGTAYTSTTLNDAAGAVSSNNVCFLLQPGTWVLSDNVTLASNITLQVPRGTTLQVAAGKTLTINGNLEAGEYAIFSGTGTIAGTPKIRIKDPTWFSGTETDNLYPSNPYTTWGSAAPESAITAPVGSVYLRTTAGSGTTAYFKESGTGNTGWIARTHIGANAIWHAGNDGAGSGLDADTVDGKNPGSVSGIATLDANSRVVEPANLVWDGVGNRSASATSAANTVPVSDSAGRIDWNRPIFEATLSANQTGITTATATKITFNTETFDTNNNYDNTTYRFTPTVAGKYLLTLNVYGGGTSMSGTEWVAIYKNGSLYRAKEITNVLGITNVYAGFVSILADANGSTDYFEAYVYIQGTSLSVTKFSNDGATIGSFFSGCRIGI